MRSPKRTKLLDGWTPLEVRKQLTGGSDICTWSPCMMFCVCEGRRQKEQHRQRKAWRFEHTSWVSGEQAVPRDGMEGDRRDPETNYSGPRWPLEGVWTSASTRHLPSSSLCLLVCDLPFWMCTQETWLVSSFKIFPFNSLVPSVLFSRCEVCSGSTHKCRCAWNGILSIQFLE